MMLHERLNALRIDKGYTHQRISDEAGIPLGTVKSIMSGATERPAFDSICAILDVLNTPISDFYHDIPAGAPAKAEFDKKYPDVAGLMNGPYAICPGVNQCDVAKGHKRMIWAQFALIVCLIAVLVFFFADALNGNWGQFAPRQ